MRPLVLIVDDDGDTREMYAEYFKPAGISTAEAEDGIQGLAKATSLVPDLVIVDLWLPKLDGIELCRRLKEQEITHGIPVIALTGATDERQLEAAKQMGCVDVLMKPCLPQTLLAEIRRILALIA